MTTRNVHRFFSKQYDRYDLSILADFTEWTGLFAPTAPVSVQQRQEGDNIFDQYTGTAAMLHHIAPSGANRFRWTGANGTQIRPYLSSATLPANRFITFPTNGHTGAPGEGNVAFGISINATTAAEQTQHVVTCGNYLVELANPQVVLTSGMLAATDVAGRVREAGPGDFYLGWIEIPAVTIGVIQYAVVQYRIPVPFPNIN